MANRPIHVTKDGSDTDGLREYADGADAGLLIPTHTTAQRNSSPSTGEIAYNSTLAALEFYNGSAWVDLNVESIQDIVGAMFTSNTETNITVTYQDADGTIDLESLSGDITGVTAGTGLSGGGTSGAVTLNVDASQAITALTGGDLTIYEDANNADVSLKLGTSATEALSIEVLNGGSNKTAEEIKIKTSTASSTANHGKISVYIDDAEILDIDDGGIDLASGMTFAINGSDIATTDTTYSAGTLLDLSSTTFNVDLTEAGEAAIADGDYLLFLDGGATGTHAKEAIGDVATLFAGTGLTASSSVIGVDASQAITALTGGDLTIFDDQNNADVSFKMGTSATEALSIEVLNGGSNKTAEEIKIKTSTASGTANHGKISVYIDDAEILDIDDGGIDLASGMTFAINGTDVVATDTTYSAGALLDLSSTTFAVDLTEAAEAAIADGDYILFLDGGATGTQSKEAVHDLATLFAGGGLTASSSVISNDVIGKQSMWVPAAAMNPTSTNGCAAIAALDSGGNTGPDLYTLDFDDGSDEHAQFSVAMPSYWNEGTVTFKVYWTSEATDTDGVAWGLSGVALADSDSLNTAFGTAVVVTDDAISAAKDLYITAESGAVTIAGSPAAGELCYFNIFRDVSDGNDDMAEDAKLIGIKLFYTIDDVHEA